MKKAFTILLLLCTTQLGAQTFQQAADSAKTDLDNSLKKLSSLRKLISVERIPMSKELSELESDALSKRNESERVRRLRDNRQFDLRSLENRIKRIRDNNNYLSSLLGDFIRRFETHIHIGELQIYKEQIDSTKLIMEDAGVDGSVRFKAQLQLLDKAFDRLERKIGGDVFSGSAVVPGGLYEEGQFATIGPLVYFSSNHSDQAGVAQMQIGSLNAVVHEVDDKFRPGIRSMVDTLSGNVPVDTTLGDALKIAAAQDSIPEHIKKGGVVMIPILGLAFFAFIIGVFKWFEIGGVKRARRRDLDAILRHLRHGDKDDALAFAKSVKGPVGEMLAAAVEHSEDEKELIEEVLYEKIVILQPKLERMLPLIAVTAATSPLLGLLGTVTGMIKTFKLITVFGTGDAKSLSSGISEALITTEFGLIIAIPSLILHAILSRKAKGVISSMEQTAVGFINGVTQIKTSEASHA